MPSLLQRVWEERIWGATPGPARPGATRRDPARRDPARPQCAPGGHSGRRRSGRQRRCVTGCAGWPLNGCSGHRAHAGAAPCVRAGRSAHRVHTLTPASRQPPAAGTAGHRATARGRWRRLRVRCRTVGRPLPADHLAPPARAQGGGRCARRAARDVDLVRAGVRRERATGRDRRGAPTRPVAACRRPGRRGYRRRRSGGTSQRSSAEPRVSGRSTFSSANAPFRIRRPGEPVSKTRRSLKSGS